MKTPKETADNWPTTVRLNDKWRVVECQDRIQWILQYRKSNRWRNRSFCGTSAALARCIREYIGPIDGLVGHLPARLDGAQTYIQAPWRVTLGGCNQIPAIEGVRGPPKTKIDYTPRFSAGPHFYHQRTPEDNGGRWLLRDGHEKLPDDERWVYVGPGYSLGDWDKRMREVRRGTRA